MNAVEFETWKLASIQRYAADKARVHDISEDEALSIAQKDFDNYLSKGLESEGNFLYTLESETSENLGVVWWGPNALGFMSLVTTHRLLNFMKASVMNPRE